MRNASVPSISREQLGCRASGATLRHVKWHETDFCHRNDLPVTARVSKRGFMAVTSTSGLISSVPQMKKQPPFRQTMLFVNFGEGAF